MSANGDSVSGYRVYVDDGFGGPFRLVLDGADQSSTYQHAIESLKCGLNYFVKVSALNTAGEGPTIEQSLWHGAVPSEPLNPVLVAVTPNTEATIGWTRPLTDGCLTIKSYTVNKDGLDHQSLIDPSLTTFTDDIRVDGAIGTLITYKVKAINEAGQSMYSQELKVTVGQVPNAPSNLRVRSYNN